MILYDYSKAKQELGWEPQTSFRDLICMMVNEDIHRLEKGQL